MPSEWTFVDALWEKLISFSVAPAKVRHLLRFYEEKSEANSPARRAEH